MQAKQISMLLLRHGLSTMQIRLALSGYLARICSIPFALFWGEGRSLCDRLRRLRAKYARYVRAAHTRAALVLTT